MNINPCMYKGGVDPIDVKLWSITQYDVARYLQNTVLGINIMTDFVRWPGVNGNSYVRMRVCIPGKDIISAAGIQGAGIIEDMLRADGAPFLFREDVLKKIEPFMLPKNLKNVRSMPDMLDELSRKGVSGQNLQDLITYSEPQYSRDNSGDWCCIYLRAEAILEDMVKEAATDKTEGLFVINNVRGGFQNRDGSIDPISWDLYVNGRKDPASQSIYNVSVESLFNNIV